MKKKFTGLIFLDLKKAFDTVSHHILLQKLCHYGVRGLAHNLFNSYLTRRKQYVYLNGCYSSTIPMQFGVLQGSNLGPILFSIYVIIYLVILSLLQCYMQMIHVYISTL